MWRSAAAGLFWLPLEPVASPTGAEVESVDGTRAFDPGAIAAVLAEGRPVFVYFTADLCLTCKVNERVVLNDEQV